MINRFLIDECLSLGLVAAAKTRGYQADHVGHIGKSGWQDWNLMPFAFAQDYVFVTNNRSDFLRRYAKLDLHNGLIIIVPNVGAAAQRRLFERALDALPEHGSDLINKVLEELVDGSVHARPWVSLDHDPNHISKPAWR